MTDNSTPKKQVLFFQTQEEFRNWLEKNHEKETELFVGFYKVNSGKPSMTWSQSVDQALCFGWIDSVRNTIDKESYCIRFTPRRSTSVWSLINIKKIEELKKAGLMKPAGLKAFDLRKEDSSAIYSYEKEEVKLDPDLENQFKSNLQAWEFFILQAPSYRKSIVRWIMSAAQEKTKQVRLEKVIWNCIHKKRIN